MKLFSIAQRFPVIRVKADELQQKFYVLGVNLDARKWVSFSLAVSLAVTVLLYAIFLDVITLLALPAVIFFIYKIPDMEIDRREREVEADMPLFLRDLGSLLNMGIPFTRSMGMLSKRKGFLGDELRRVMKEVKRGSSLIKELSQIAARSRSSVIKRAVAQIIAAYEHGSGEELKRISNELLNVQRYKLREYAAKNTIYGQFFIMLSVVGPALYLMVQVIGPAIFMTEFSEASILFGMVVLFPALSYMLLTINKATLPVLSFRGAGGRSQSIMLAVLITFVFMLSLNIFERLIVLAAVLVIAVSLVAKRILEIRKTGILEKNLPDALLLISTMPHGSHIQNIINKLAESSIPEINEEFMKVKKQTTAGVSVEKALRDMVERIKSPLLERVIDVLENSFRAGGSIGERIAEIADDILAYFEVKREQAAMLATQKYTLVAGMFLVPLVMGISMSLSQRMIGIIGGGVNLEYTQSSVIPAYLVLISAVISDYMAHVEGDRSRELLYFAVFALASNIILYIVMQQSVVA